jgi:hypothetical protein
MDCLNFKLCKRGEGSEINPVVEVKEVLRTGYYEVVACDSCLMDSSDTTRRFSSLEVR